jgi:hypothetical protein
MSVLTLENDPQFELPKKEKKPKKALRPKNTSTKGNYINNADLMPEMLISKELGYVTPKLANMFFQVVSRYSLSKSFSHLTFKEDMVSNAMVNLMANGLKFNPERSDNVFSYVTQCSYHSFLHVIADEKKQRNIRDKLLLDSGMNGSASFMETGHEEFKEGSDLYGSDWS